jgi:hypothetical protein
LGRDADPGDGCGRISTTTRRSRRSGHRGQAGDSGAAAKLGADGVNTPNLKWPECLNTGITVVGKRAVVPPVATIGRNVVIFPRAAAKDYPGLEVASGETIGG